MNDKVKHYLNAWRVKGNIYASEKAARLGSYFGSTWFKNEKLFQQGSPHEVIFSSRESQMAEWEKKNGSFKEQFPNLYKDYLKMKDD